MPRRALPRKLDVIGLTHRACKDKQCLGRNSNYPQGRSGCLFAWLPRGAAPNQATAPLGANRECQRCEVTREKLPPCTTVYVCMYGVGCIQASGLYRAEEKCINTQENKAAFRRGTVTKFFANKKQQHNYFLGTRAPSKPDNYQCVNPAGAFSSSSQPRLCWAQQKARPAPEPAPLPKGALCSFPATSLLHVSSDRTSGKGISSPEGRAQTPRACHRANTTRHRVAAGKARRNLKKEQQEQKE